jgi:CheY-like chemotaxis protein
MSLWFTAEQVAGLRRDVRTLIDGAGHQQGQLEALVAAADADVRHAEAGVSHAADDLALAEIRAPLSAPVERSAGRAAAAKRLLASVRQQHAVACRLLACLERERRGANGPNAVLVVDDYVDVRDLLARVLEDAGYVVRTAANGLEALIAAYEMQPGVIVMDIAMPLLDGIEATRLIKAVEATRDARVIAHTGNPSVDEGAAGKLFVAVLTKPATPDEVLAAVQHVAAL